MPSDSFILCVVIFGVLLQSGTALNRTQCFDCQQIASPRDCNTITNCAYGQKCYVMQYVTENAHVKYDLGCMSMDRCNSVSNGRRRSDSVTTCLGCCDGKMCNNQGCTQSLPARQDRGPLCYNCKHLVDPRACRTVTLCEKDHFCDVHSTIQGSNTVLYTSECIRMEACNPIHNLTSITHRDCPMCCSDDYCNDHCRHV